MVTSFIFSEAKIARLPAPDGDKNARDWHKDTKCVGLQVAVYRTGQKVYFLVKRLNGKPARIRLGTADELSVQQARDAADAQRGDIARGIDVLAPRRAQRHNCTLEELHAKWLEYASTRVKKPKKATSLDEDKRNFETHCGTLEKKRLGSITKSDIRKLHQTIGDKRGIYAANRTLSLLSAMINFAKMDIDEGGLGFKGENPCKGVHKYEEKSRERFLQPEELKPFFTALDKESQIFQDFFRVCLFTGARKSNVLSMKWADVNLIMAKWTIPDTKNNEPHTIPLTEPVLQILQERRKNCISAVWVFEGHKNGDHLRCVKDAWTRIMDSAKLETPLRIHDLRRSVGSWCAGQNVSLLIIGKLLGHKTSQATEIYSRVNIDPQRIALENATQAMLAAGKQAPEQLTIDVESS